MKKIARGSERFFFFSQEGLTGVSNVEKLAKGVKEERMCESDGTVERRRNLGKR